MLRLADRAGLIIAATSYGVLNPSLAELKRLYQILETGVTRVAVENLRLEIEKQEAAILRRSGYVDEY